MRIARYLRGKRFLLTHLLRGATAHGSPIRANYLQFLLTHLLRGATGEGEMFIDVTKDFYSRTSCEVRLFLPGKGNVN